MHTPVLLYKSGVQGGFVMQWLNQLKIGSLIKILCQKLFSENSANYIWFRFISNQGLIYLAPFGLDY